MLDGRENGTVPLALRNGLLCLRKDHGIGKHLLKLRVGRKIDVFGASGQLGLTLHGRFGDFEYINMDQVIERSMKQAKEILS